MCKTTRTMVIIKRAIGFAFIMLALSSSPIEAAIVYSQGFDGVIDYTTTTEGPGNWSVVSLGTTGFSSGGSQSGNIFFGSSTVNGGLTRSIIEFPLVDLSDFINTTFSLSLAAATGWWEDYQDDGVYIYLNDNLIDSFRSNSNRNLESQVYSTTINNSFSDYAYIFNAEQTELRIELVSTDPTEQIAIDSILFSGSQIPIPGAVWLLGSGLIALFGLRKKLKN